MFQITLSEKTLNQETIQTVNARDLHSVLEVKDHFANWIKARIEKYGFVENQDFTTLSEKSEKGRPSKEYYISIDMAKELSMVERNDKGKEARRYFIEVEKELQQQQLVPVTSDAVTLAQIELEKLKLTEKTKQMEIEAKIQLAKKKTNIRRKPNCPKGYLHMKAYERTWEDANKPIPLSVLKKIRESYWDSISTMANCVHEKRFDDAIEEVFGRFQDDGAYWVDPETGIRTLKAKIDWL